MTLSCLSASAIIIKVPILNSAPITTTGGFSSTSLPPAVKFGGTPLDTLSFAPTPVELELAGGSTASPRVGLPGARMERWRRPARTREMASG
eukprot:1159798-Amorphochlora_amoeboformis.AAC.1